MKNINLTQINFTVSLIKTPKGFNLEYKVTNNGIIPIYLLDIILDYDSKGSFIILPYAMIVAQGEESNSLNFIRGYSPHPVANVSNELLPACRIVNKDETANGQAYIDYPLVLWHPDIGKEALLNQPMRATVKIGMLPYGIEYYQAQTEDGTLLKIPLRSEVEEKQQWLISSSIALNQI